MFYIELKRSIHNKTIIYISNVLWAIKQAKDVLNEELNVDKVLELKEESYELVNDLAWYFIKGAGGRWIVGAY